jgi:hypothetical protein
MAESMFGDYSSIFDAASADNVAVRDRALDVAQLQPGRASVYGAHQAGGMLMQNLANMAGMKTARQEKAELISNIMRESQNLDPSDPASSLTLSRKFIEAGFPDIGQKFAQKHRDMVVKNRELTQKDTELSQQKTHYSDLASHYTATATHNTAELEFREATEATRVSDLAAKLEIDKAALERLINMGELVQVPVPGNKTGAMTWATRKCDDRGQNCTVTPLMAEGYQPPAAPVTTVVDGQVVVDSTDDTEASINLNTLEGLGTSGYLISDFGAAPTGTAENRAYNVIRDNLIAKNGEEEGNKLFLERLQQDKAALESADVNAQVAVSLFSDVRESRLTHSEKLDMISTAISGFSQAKAGNSGAGKMAEGLVQQIFMEKRLAVSEITRIAKAGSLPENIVDAMNSLFDGVKTTQHYDAFLDLLKIYEKEQTGAYNNKSDIMKEYAKDMGIKVPNIVFEHRATPSGGKGFILRYNEETEKFDRVQID